MALQLYAALPNESVSSAAPSRYPRQSPAPRIAALSGLQACQGRFPFRAALHRPTVVRFIGHTQTYKGAYIVFSIERRGKAVPAREDAIAGEKGDSRGSDASR
ncbi:hypothetical protein L1887_47887 [Cichorium endivia]|nr:hypothetical protein L1887_47887 [Cichorium endivia]